MMDMERNRAIARATFDEIRESFSDLSMRANDTGEGDPQLEIPEQPGLGFGLTLYLYDDVLNVVAGQFWGEWFPCTKTVVVSRYVDAVTGLLAGRLRIVEHYRKGKLLKAHLQRPDGEGWETFFRHYRGFSLPWLATEQRILL